MTTLRITEGKGFHLEFDNGYVISVQIGPGNYSDNYDAPYSSGNKIPTLLPSETAEIAVFKDGEWCCPRAPFNPIPGGGTDVRGYVPLNEVLDLIETLRNI